MIHIKKVSKIYKTGDFLFHALKNVSLEIGDGEFVSIVGKSGSGKSTLLNLIGTLDSVSEGKIVIDNNELTALDKNQIAVFRNKNLGFVFQSFYLEPEYTVYENIELPLILSGSFGKGNKEKIESALELVDLTKKTRNKAKTLSGGECQRVAIARAMINNPNYILADEPCGNLDTANTENIMNIFGNLHKMGKTILMVTHDEREAQLAHRIITLSDGQVINDEKNILSLQI